MQKYINQLLLDINAASEPKDSSQKQVNEQNVEAYFAEVERYIYDTPTQSLGTQIGLKCEQFPSPNLLTDGQCLQLVAALKHTYFSHGIALAMPEEIPVKVKYQTLVDTLERNVFLEQFGICTIECCHYDFDGYCGFGVKQCPCYQEWATQVAALKQESPVEHLGEIDALDVYWFDFLTAYETCKRSFEQSQTPNKAIAQQLWQKLEQTHQLIHEKEVGIFFQAREEDLPVGEYRTLFDWLGVENVKFPKQHELNDLELQLLTMALIQLLGKELIVLTILDWQTDRQYEELTAHFSRWMKRKYPHFRLICQPQAITLHDKVKAEPNKFKSDYDNFLNTTMERPTDLLWFQQDNFEDDELPF